MTTRELEAREGSCVDFARDGFSLLRKFLDASEVQRVHDAIVLTRKTPRGPSCTRPHNVLMPLSWNDAPIEVVLRSPERVERVRRSVGARDLRWISGYVSTKPASSPPLWWHQDWWCWDHPISFQHRAPQVALLCYLTDTHRENGALRVIPRTHHRSIPLHAALPEAHASEANELGCEHAALSDHPDQHTIEAQAGDGLVLVSEHAA
jgi:hypothetical protein